MIDFDQLASLDPSNDYELLPLVDILINTMSLAFLADNSTLES